jgi:hypothetical protein
MEHLDNNITNLKRYLGQTVQFLIHLNTIVIEGSDYRTEGGLSGDSALDSLLVPRTVKDGSKNVDLLYTSHELLEAHSGDKDIFPRIYGVGQTYGGVAALFNSVVICVCMCVFNKYVL